MIARIINLLLAPLCILALFILHILIHRLISMKSFIVSFVISLFLTAFLAMIVQYFLYRLYSISILNFIVYLLTNLIILLCMGYIYINILTIGDVSIRIKLLNYFKKHNSLTEKEILADYNAREIIDKRIDRLLQNGQLVLKEDRLIIGKKRQIYVAKFYMFWRKIMFGSDKVR